MSVNKDDVVLQFNVLKFNLCKLAGTEAGAITNKKLSKKFQKTLN